MATERKKPSVYFKKIIPVRREEPEIESTIKKINRLSDEKIEIYRGLTLGQGGHRGPTPEELRRLGEIEGDLFQLWLTRKKEQAGPRFKEIY